MNNKAKHPARNIVFFILELAFIPLILWWGPYSHLPAPGWAVAFIAGAAAAMSVHDDMDGWQKALWMLIIGAFLITELRAISKDRAINDAHALEDRQLQDGAFRSVRNQQDSDFRATGRNLEAAISAINSTLQTANKTLRQTQPHAMFGTPDRFAQIALTPGSNYISEVHFKNIGNDVAVKAHRYSNSYVGKPDNVEAERNAIKLFELDWKIHKNDNQGSGQIAVGQDVFSSYPSNVFTASQIEQIRAGKLTIYTISRISYTDATGSWVSDSCDDIQVPIMDGAKLFFHTCVNPMDPRYRAKN